LIDDRGVALMCRSSIARTSRSRANHETAHSLSRRATFDPPPSTVTGIWAAWADSQDLDDLFAAVRFDQPFGRIADAKCGVRARAPANLKRSAPKVARTTAAKSSWLRGSMASHRLHGHQRPLLRDSATPSLRAACRR